MKKTILVAIAFLSLSFVNAQEGKPSVKVFSNFNYDLSAEEGETAFKEFEIKRAYLGYGYKFDDKFSAKVTFDVGNNDGGSAYTAFLKIASLTWKTTDNLIVNFGQIGTKNFKFMEKAWGRRYVAKAVQDKYKWASSADVGVSADYRIMDNLTVDAQVLNGEGYKKSQSAEGKFRGGFGITYTLGDRVALRVHHDVMPRTTYGDNDASQEITAFALAYKGKNFNLGAEKNIMQNAGNTVDLEKSLFAVYGTYNINDKYAVFGRYDDVASTDDWNIAKDGAFTLFGIERKMTKGVTMAINMQSWTGAAEGSEAEGTLFLNLEYKF